MRRLKALALVLVLVLAVSTTVLADDWVIEPFMIESHDGGMVFHFNPHKDAGLPATGLYYNTEPLELIYLVEHTLPWNAFEQDFFFSHDMRYFAFVPQIGQTVGVAFYANGVLQFVHNIHDLVRDHYVISYSTTMAFWREGVEFFPDNNVLTITTLDERTYTFDLTTGLITAISAGIPNFGTLFLSLLGFMLAGFAFLQFAKRRYAPPRRRGYYDR